jgi:hypothetical protein
LKRVYFVEYTPFYQMRLYLAMAFQRWHTHERVSDYRQFEFGTARTTAIRMIDDIAYRGIGVFILHLLLFFCIVFFSRNMYILWMGGRVGASVVVVFVPRKRRRKGQILYVSNGGFTRKVKDVYI